MLYDKINIMEKEKLQIITLSTSKSFLDPSTIPAKNLQEQADKIEKYILVNFQKTNYKIKKKGNILFIEVPRLKFIFYIKPIIKEIKKVLNKNIKTVITAGNPFDLGMLGILFKILLKFPLNIQIHTDIYSKHFLKSKKRHYIYYLISKITLLFADSIRTVSKNVKNKLEEKYPNKLIKNIIEIADFSEMEISSEKNKEGLLYLCPARYDRGKNLINLINAFIEFHTVYKDTRLKIVGSGYLENELHDLLRKKEANNYIELPGWSKDMPNEYTKANYTILPSLFEGYGMIIIESMHQGTPFLATPFGGGTELIIEDLNGYIAKDFSKKEIYNLLIKSYKNKDKFNPNFVKSSVKDLTKDKMDEQLIDLWKETN